MTQLTYGPQYIRRLCNLDIPTAPEQLWNSLTPLGRATLCAACDLLDNFNGWGDPANVDRLIAKHTKWYEARVNAILALVT